MNVDEFQSKYHDYSTKSGVDAVFEALRVNKDAVGFSVSVVNFGDLGYCLMLDTAIEALKEMYGDTDE